MGQKYELQEHPIIRFNFKVGKSTQTMSKEYVQSTVGIYCDISVIKLILEKKEVGGLLLVGGTYK